LLGCSTYGRRTTSTPVGKASHAWRVCMDASERPRGPFAPRALVAFVYRTLLVVAGGRRAAAAVCQPEGSGFVVGVDERARVEAGRGGVLRAAATIPMQRRVARARDDARLVGALKGAAQ